MPINRINRICIKILRVCDHVLRRLDNERSCSMGYSVSVLSHFVIPVALCNNKLSHFVINEAVALCKIEVPLGLRPRGFLSVLEV